MLDSAPDEPVATPVRAPRIGAGPIPALVEQHAEEVAWLRQLRSMQVRAPNAGLRELRRLDDRIAAHIDALHIAGAFGTACCRRALDRPGTGTLFAATVNAIESEDMSALQRLLAIAEALPDAAAGLVSAFGWVPAPRLRGLVRPLLTSENASRLQIGLAACRLHRVDPGAPLLAALGHDVAAVRAQALRLAGALGRIDCADRVQAALADPALAFDAAQTLCLLGRGADARQVLYQHASSVDLGESRGRAAALSLLMFSLSLDAGRSCVRSISQLARGHPGLERAVIRGCGLLGDIASIPWLIERIDDATQGRSAGEAFCLITGADGAELAVRLQPARQTQAAEAEAFALDEQEGLPWLDRGRVEQWWAGHAASFDPQQRYFMGATPAPAHLERLLKTATQRQRWLAAQYACVVQPGRQLFDCLAPAWRQHRLLDGLT